MPRVKMYGVTAQCLWESRCRGKPCMTKQRSADHMRRRGPARPRARACKEKSVSGDLAEDLSAASAWVESVVSGLLVCHASRTDALTHKKGTFKNSFA